MKTPKELFDEEADAARYIVRHRKTKRYKRDLARFLSGKPIPGFIDLPGRAGTYIENPAKIDGEQQQQGPSLNCNAINYARFYSRSHNAVIRVFDEDGKVIARRDELGVI